MERVETSHTWRNQTAHISFDLKAQWDLCCLNYQSYRGWTRVGKDGIPHFLESWPPYEAKEYLRDHPVDLLASNEADIDKGGPEEQVVDSNSLPDPPV